MTVPVPGWQGFDASAGVGLDIPTGAAREIDLDGSDTITLKEDAYPGRAVLEGFGLARSY
jgi:hypothetical protein